MSGFKNKQTNIQNKLKLLKSFENAIISYRITCGDFFYIMQ